VLLCDKFGSVVLGSLYRQTAYHFFRRTVWSVRSHCVHPRTFSRTVAPKPAATLIFKGDKKPFTCVQLFISYNKPLCCRMQILTEVLSRFVIGLSALKLDNPFPLAGI